VRFPRLQLRRHHLSNAEKRAIVARLGTGGGPFVAALDELEAAAAHAANASVLEKDAHATWQDALRTVARRLEAAWLALEAEVEAERERWNPRSRRSPPGDRRSGRSSSCGCHSPCCWLGSA